VTRRDAIGLVRAAFGAAALFLAGGVVPMVGGVAMLFAPTPVLGYAIGYPRTLWRMAAVVTLATGLIALGAGPPAAAAYLLTFGLATIVMVYLIERRRPFETIVLCTAAVMLLAGVAVALAFARSPAALAEMLRHDLTTAMARGEKFYKTVGIDSAIPPETRANIVEATLRLSPALAILAAAFTVLINLGVFWRLSGRQQRLGYMLFNDLVRWSTPDWLIWVLLTTGFGLFIPVAALSTIALDLFVCVVAVYFCQGLAIMAFYFKVLAMPPLARGLIYFVTIVQPVLAALVCAVGIFDLWIDFRRLKPPSPEARNLGDFL
jgi:uncharacterized protein YybS (DUF2232 family)